MRQARTGLPYPSRLQPSRSLAQASGPTAPGGILREPRPSSKPRGGAGWAEGGREFLCDVSTLLAKFQPQT